MRVDVQQLLEALGLRWRRQGHRLWACCPHPEHDDHDPSWAIIDDPGGERHGRHQCYGCGWGGGPPTLVSVVRQIPMREAIDWLQTGRFDLPLLGIELCVRDDRDRRLDGELPVGCVRAPLEEWPTVPRRYLERRRVSAESVERWQIRYAVEGPLRGRVVFPVLDGEGAIVSFTARTFLEGSHIRYMTPLAGRPVLLGCHLWSGRRDRIVVVEGPFDAVAVEVATGLPVAALLGSNPQPVQLAALSSFERVDVLTDGDAAGDKAAEALRSLGRWARVERRRLPAGLDPGAASVAELRRVIG